MEKFVNLQMSRKMAETVATGALAIIPGVGPGLAVGYTILQICMDRAAELKNQQAKKRITDFSKRLLSDDIEPISFDEEVIEDYTRLIESMIRDDEDEKADYYSRMFVSFATENIGKNEKLHLLKTVRELTSYDIEAVRKMYVYHNFDVKGTSAINVSAHTYCLPKLIDMHILEAAEGKQSLSQIGARFLHLIYSEDELTPEAIGWKVWRNITYHLVSFSDLNTNEYELHGRVLDAFSAILNDYDFKTEGWDLMNSRLEKYKLLYPGRLLVIHDGKTQGKLAETLCRRLAGGCGIVVCVTDAPENDSLAHLKEEEQMVYFTMPKNHDCIPEIADKFRRIMESIVEHEKTHST
ncbi:hypothetical protein [Pseudodesulfovibrio methanolicus]|uniref:Uncharacterized protein n=1 Tax=Pseudodesulfovibrio methanolicus TaxID=3126690 RepID=A0ABZ2IUL3_9BACT